MVESKRAPGKGTIRASIEKLSRQSIGKGSNQCEYRKMVDSGRVLGKGRFRASIENLSDEYRKRVESV